VVGLKRPTLLATYSIIPFVMLNKLYISGFPTGVNLMAKFADGYCAANGVAEMANISAVRANVAVLPLRSHVASSSLLLTFAVFTLVRVKRL